MSAETYVPTTYIATRTLSDKEPVVGTESGELAIVLGNDGSVVFSDEYIIENHEQFLKIARYIDSVLQGVGK